MDINKVLKFVRFTNDFANVRRQIFKNGTDSFENDLEHSGQLALLAMYIAEAGKFHLDMEKVLLYAIVHDLVEVYAGDTFYHSKDAALIESKGRREKEAYLRIKSEFPESKLIHEGILGFESLEDEESKFVYVLDKMIPVFNIYIDNGRSWKSDKVSIDMVKSKYEKIKKFPKLLMLWEEIILLLENTEDLFESI